MHPQIRLPPEPFTAHLAVVGELRQQIRRGQLDDLPLVRAIILGLARRDHVFTTPYGLALAILKWRLLLRFPPVPGVVSGEEVELALLEREILHARLIVDVGLQLLVDARRGGGGLLDRETERGCGADDFSNRVGQASRHRILVGGPVRIEEDADQGLQLLHLVLEDGDAVEKSMGDRAILCDCRRRRVEDVVHASVKVVEAGVGSGGREAR